MQPALDAPGWQGKLHGDDHFRLRGEISWRQVEDEVIVLDKRNWGYLSLNPTGGRLWVALSDGATRAKLVAILTETTDVDPARAETDVQAFLDALREHDLLDR
jgi:hypothetical protein